MASNQLMRSLIWAGIPIVVLIGWFGLIAVVNLDYELKFFQPMIIHGQSDPWLGSKLLAAGAAFGLGSSAFAFLASHQVTARKWLKAVLSILVSVTCFLMALAFIVLGPAVITMLEQMS